MRIRGKTRRDFGSCPPYSSKEVDGRTQRLLKQRPRIEVSKKIVEFYVKIEHISCFLFRLQFDIFGEVFDSEKVFDSAGLDICAAGLYQKKIQLIRHVIRKLRDYAQA